MRSPQRSITASSLTLTLFLSEPCRAQVTQRVSGGMHDQPADLGAFGTSISADGRFVAFSSFATNLVPGDTNGKADVFVRDRSTGKTERMSVTSSGVQGNANSGSLTGYLYSGQVAISADARFVAFTSAASNLVRGDTNDVIDIFVTDRQAGALDRVSVASDGSEGNGETSPYFGPAISGDGRFVVFASRASNLVARDTNLSMDVFVRDRWNGTTSRVSVDSNGVEGNAPSCSHSKPAISEDGRFVAFQSDATNLVPADTNGRSDIFVHDQRTGATDRVSVGTGAFQFTHDSNSPTISADGRFVAFSSFQGPGGWSAIFVRDRDLGTTIVVSGGGTDYYEPAISADGRCVASAVDSFDGYEIDLDEWPTGHRELISVAYVGPWKNCDCWSPSISGDGRYVAFDSCATNILPGSEGNNSAYVRDRIGGTNFTSACEPAAAGVIACPCSNPPSGSGRGCDNSSASGGAALSAVGGTYVSSDSLVFRTTGEPSSAMTVFFQGRTSSASGSVYGQGVQCVAGSVVPLYVKIASLNGAADAPHLAAREPLVTLRSATRGDLIRPGQRRWYFASYRDSIVLGGCPASSTFNATQAGVVTWSP